MCIYTFLVEYFITHQLPKSSPLKFLCLHYVDLSRFSLATMANENLGVAFSGGGIRSAAFCSGVLRRLITKKKEPDYLSCVSGGGYTGSSFVQWKYHNGGNTGDWADAFFDHMRTRTGHFCNWQSCTSGFGSFGCIRGDNRSDCGLGFVCLSNCVRCESFVR